MSIIVGDCIEVMATMEAASVDAIVTDPPYGLGFMGKEWDALPPGEPWARECLRVLKPGGHLLAFGGTRTSHRLVVAIEDAGFEIRDTVLWLYGSGFPKNRQTALKPAHEPIALARKPLIGTVAKTVATHGTGALRIDDCRIEAEERPVMVRTTARQSQSMENPTTGATNSGEVTTQGRWPANVALDPEAAGLLDEQTGTLTSGKAAAGGHRRNGDKFRTAYGSFEGQLVESTALYGDSGGASRFFYCAKAAKGERNAGLDGFPLREAHTLAGGEMVAEGRTAVKGKAQARNIHPTVKPIALMRWLCRLVTPTGGVVLDPFAGSGTTGCAAILEGLQFVGIEREPEYAEIARARIAHWAAQPGEPAQLDLGEAA